MKWCQFEGTTFDQSKVTHFTLDNYPPGNDDRYQLRGHLNFSWSHDDDKRDIFTQAWIVIGKFDTQSSREQAILDICAGKYDLPGQTDFVEVSTGAGYETEYINMAQVRSVNWSMGGLQFKFADGTTFDFGNTEHDSIHDDMSQSTQDSVNSILRGLGLPAYGVLLERGIEAESRAKEKEVQEPDPETQPMVLHHTTLKNDYSEDIYKTQADTYWVIRADMNGKSVAWAIELSGVRHGIDIADPKCKVGDVSESNFVIHKGE